jgi:hypothetical protein
MWRVFGVDLESAVVVHLNDSCRAFESNEMENKSMREGSVTV